MPHHDTENTTAPRPARCSYFARINLPASARSNGNNYPWPASETVMIGYIGGKPVQSARQNQITGSLVPVSAIARIRVLEIVLNGEQDNARAARERGTA